ncbi:MAG: putative addiction module antidote protein [Oxalobacteraceae bacterium]|nr:putative addiction module antidote protein [Oxalobacteraceae bacterium]
MKRMINANDLPNFDVSDYLEDADAIAEYLTVVLEDGDPALLIAAIGDIARAKGMSEVSRESGLAREALYKALRAGSQPRFDTVMRVLKTLGVRLVAQPMTA